MTISQMQNLGTDMGGAVGTESTGAHAPATSGLSAGRKTADSKRCEANFVGHGVDDDSEDDIGLPPGVSHASHASPRREVMYVHPQPSAYPQSLSAGLATSSHTGYASSSPSPVMRSIPSSHTGYAQSTPSSAMRMVPSPTPVSYAPVATPPSSPMVQFPQHSQPQQPMTPQGRSPYPQSVR